MTRGGMDMQTIKRSSRAATGVVIVALFAAACGSSGSSGSAAVPEGVPTSGPGFTQPTSPSGTKIPGGTVYFTQGPNASPNYIFPMYTFDVCSTPNVNEFMDMMYRPLYWYGNNYSPTVDYNYSIGRKPVRP
jgi:peptide/nickel transport system substrate-binding protein